MASLVSACRLSARVARSRVVSEATFRGYQTSSRCLAAQNFTMPALSPTMTEGNIATWKVKEGDSYSAGDVLLEIETDKATMDVEAQDDGILMKIIQGDGTKAVQVGTRIAVMAEPGDDISTLQIPAEGQTGAPQQPAAQAESKPAEQAGEPKVAAAPRATSGKVYEQKYPLMPSVLALLKQNRIEESAASQITPTGPNGRLLKGDVLAYLGTINAETPAQLSTRFDKLAHLDLSNIKVAPKKEAPKAKKPAAPEPPAAPQKAEISIPVSMSRVLEIQKKIHGSVGTFLPISTFISRAADVANDDLPPSVRKPTADELFNDVLGIKNRADGTRGVYNPKIQALRDPAFIARRTAPSKPSDIIDMLAGSSKKARPAASLTTPGLSTGTNVFSLTVPKAEEKRATVFLERVKLILENEPGRLVL